MYSQRWLKACSFLAFAALVAVAAPPTRAQPTQPQKIIIGFAPGGSVDALARIVAEQLQSASSRSVIVENRTGAAGRLALDQVKRAAPDGDTLLLVPQGPMTLFQHIFKRMPFDPSKDFVPISRVATGDYALTIGPSVPAKDFNGLRNWLKTADNKANFGSPGAGTVPHFLGVSIARQLGTPMTHVPYRGSALAMNDLAGGSIAAAVSPVTEALELHKAGRVRIIATTGNARSPFVEGVPTLKELGIDLDVPLWFGIYAPAATPTATVDRLRSTIQSGLGAPITKERFAKLGLVPSPSSGAELAAQQRHEADMWGPIVKTSGFTPED